MMAISDLKEAHLILILILALISSVLNFAIIVMFLRIREKQPIHRFFLMFNISLLAFSLGLLGYVTLINHIDMVQVDWSQWVVTLPFIIGYAGLTSAGAHWFFLAASYTENRQWTRGKSRTFAYLPTCVVTITLMTTPILQMLFDVDIFPTAYQIVNFTSTISVAIFVLLAFRFYFMIAFDTRRKHAGVMTSISFIPLLGGLLYLSSFVFLLPYESDLNIVIQWSSVVIANVLLAFRLLRMGSVNLLSAAIRKIFYNLEDGVLVLDNESRIIHFNTKAEDIFPNVHPGQSINEQVYQIGSKMEHMKDDPSKNTELEINLKGFSYWVRILPIKSANQHKGWIIIFSDITKLKHVEAELVRNALHDRLTELPNRTLLLDRLNHAISSAQRDEKYKYALLCMDLDRFKSINDTFGLQAGDQVLIEVAKRLQKCLRKVDTVARLEGDEFVILLEKIGGVRAATEVSLRVLELLSQRITLEGKDTYPSVSIGIAMGSPRHKKPDDILRDAEIALQQAKQRGKGQYVIFDKEMHTHVSTLFHLENSLREAVQKNEFMLHYQPILSLPDKDILGFEALLRWTHPQHGMMLPPEFLPEAEGSDLIIPMGHWGIQQACQDLSNWIVNFPHNPPLMMNINLSQRQLFEPDLVDRIASILEETGVSPSCLAFEVKEKILMENDPEMLDVLLKLKSINVRLVIDQFGTGYSTLRMLPSLPFDIIKIDRSFIRNIARSKKDFEIVRGIIELGQRLNMDVIAEGIESPHEFVELQSINCRQAQGDYLSKPLDRDAIYHLLNELSQMKTVESKINHKKLI